MMCGVGVAWLLLGAALTRRFRDPATSRKMNIAFAVLLVASVAFAFLH
jgi:threonine/homoserine/homoserine lactone efflux protein